MKYLLVPDELKTICEPVLEGEDWSELLEDMMNICNGRNCVGLAANQLGVPKQIIAINYKNWRHIFFNPEIIKTWGMVKAKDEMCMSFPGRKVRVLRPSRCRIIAKDVLWQDVTYAPTEYVARIIMHEIDHINGKTMIDRARNGKV